MEDGEKERKKEWKKKDFNEFLILQGLILPRPIQVSD